jgi:hypothetical protein
MTEQSNILLAGGPYDGRIMPLPPPGTHITLNPEVTDDPESVVHYSIIDTGDRYLAVYLPRQPYKPRLYSPKFDSGNAAEWMRHYAASCERMADEGVEIGDMNEDLGWAGLGHCLRMAASVLDGKSVEKGYPLRWPK